MLLHLFVILFKRGVCIQRGLHPGAGSASRGGGSASRGPASGGSPFKGGLHPGGVG